MSKNKTCILCNKRGRNETIMDKSFTLCALHNQMIELDTIDTLLLLAEQIEPKTNDLESFIQACYKFKNEV